MNDTLVYGLSTILFGFLAVVVRYAFKSKCVRIKCCGIVDIERDVMAELKEDEPPEQADHLKRQGGEEVKDIL
jgi:hypothetical protein